MPREQRQSQLVPVIRNRTCLQVVFWFINLRAPEACEEAQATIPFICRFGGSIFPLDEGHSELERRLKRFMRERLKKNRNRKRIRLVGWQVYQIIFDKLHVHSCSLKISYSGDWLLLFF
jgi:hypothetical protein